MEEGCCVVVVVVVVVVCVCVCVCVWCSHVRWTPSLLVGYVSDEDQG